MNMTYIAFENTFNDLRQCRRILEDGGPSSKSEIRYAKRLVELCKEVTRDYDESITERHDQLKSKANT